MGNPPDAAVLREERRVLLAATGEDRASFLHGMLTNDVAGLAAGGGVAALLLTEQGRITASLTVLAEDERLLLDLDAEAAARLEPALAKFIVADDIEFEKVEAHGVALFGADARDALATIAEGELPAAEGAHGGLTVAGCPVLVVAVPRTEAAVLRVFAETAGDAETIVAALETAGCASLDAAAAEDRRIREGLAREGVDYDGGTLAPEVPSLASAVSFRKGCYLGQEVVERVAARGKVNWLVQGLELEAPVAVGSELHHDGKAVGQVSSVSSGERAVAAIARLRREIVENESAVEVAGASGPVRGTVASVAAAEE